jgi:hypothetical protein
MQVLRGLSTSLLGEARKRERENCVEVDMKKVKKLSNCFVQQRLGSAKNMLNNLIARTTHD